MTLTTPAPIEASPSGPRRTVRGGDCEARLGGPGGTLQCTREAGHAPGCVYTSTSGVPDRHTATSGE